jgi:hypothetical protein
VLDRLSVVAAMSGHFQCAMCGEIHEHVRDETWSEEKAMAEWAENFPGCDKADRAAVCDDCYNKMIAEYPPSDFMAGR